MKIIDESIIQNKIILQEHQDNVADDSNHDEVVSDIMFSLFIVI